MLQELTYHTEVLGIVGDILRVRARDVGFGDLAGVMQHTQYDGWSSGHNDYDWDNSSQSWEDFYSNLRNCVEYENKAIKGEYEFHQGVALIMKAYNI